MAGSPRPIARRRFPATGEEFETWISTPDACRDYLFDMRWRDQWRCTGCGASALWWRTATVFRCSACRREYSVTAGTIFDRTRTPLELWFAAGWRIAVERDGISAVALKDAVGCQSLQTAWMMLHRYRRAMAVANSAQLTGHVEIRRISIDARPVGAPARKSATRRRTPVLVMAEADRKRRVGRVRFAALRRRSASALHRAIVDGIESGSRVATDGGGSYRGLEGLGFVHDRGVEREAGASVDSRATIDGVGEELQRWLLATYHGGVRADHLQAYLDEFGFRWSHRKRSNDGHAFHALMEGAVRHAPVTYDAIATRRGPAKTRRPVPPHRRPGL